MDVAQTVRAEISTLLEARGLAVPPISASDALSATLGLSSLDIVSLAPRLTAMLGVDPFAGTLAITDMRTVGDLIRAYDHVRRPAPDSALLAAARRAQMRRKPAAG